MALKRSADTIMLTNYYKKHHSLFKSKALEIVKNEKDAEDIVQSTFIKLIEHIDTIHTMEKATLMSYTLKTIRRLSLNHVN